MIINFSNIGTSGGGGEYVLPVATDSRLGGVKVGSGLSITSDGVLSSEGGAGKSTWKLTYDGSAVYGATGLYAKIASYTDLADFFEEQEVILADSAEGNTFVLDSLTDVDTHYLLEGSAGVNQRAVLFVGDAMVDVEYMELVDTTALDEKQDVLTAGEGISISGNTISATGGAGGDYKIVDELPEDAEDGTMVYLTADQYRTDELSVVGTGYVFRLSDIPAWAEHFIDYKNGDDWDIVWVNMFGSGDIVLRTPYLGDYQVPQDAEWHFNVDDGAGVTVMGKHDPETGLVYIAVAEYNNPITATIMDGLTPVDTFNTYEKTTLVAEKGQYLRENGEWVAKKDVPSLVYNSGDGYLTDEQKADFDAVGAAYKAGEPYHLFVDKRPCIIDMYDEGNAEMWCGSVNTNLNSNMVKYYGSIVRRDGTPNVWTKDSQIVEHDGIVKVFPGDEGVVVPAGECYHFHSDNLAETWYGRILVSTSYYGLIGFHDNGVIVGREDTYYDSSFGWKFVESDGCEIYVKVDIVEEGGVRSADAYVVIATSAEHGTGYDTFYVEDYEQEEIVIYDKLSIMKADGSKDREVMLEPGQGGIPKVGSGELPDLETAADGGDVVAETYRADAEGEWVPTGDIVCDCDALPGESYYEWDWESEKVSVDSVTINIQDSEFDSKWNREHMPDPGLYIAIDGAGDTLLRFEVLDGVLYCDQDGTCEGYEPVYAEAELNAGPVTVSGTFRHYCDDPSTEYTRTFSMEYMDGKVEITGLDASTDFIVIYNGQKYNWVEEEGEMMFDSLRVANKHPNDLDGVDRNWDYIPTSSSVKNIKFISQSEYERMSHDSNTLYITWNDQA